MYIEILHSPENQQPNPKNDGFEEGLSIQISTVQSRDTMASWCIWKICWYARQHGVIFSDFQGKHQNIWFGWHHVTPLNVSQR